MSRADGIHFRTGPAPRGRDGPADPMFDVMAPDAPTLLNEPEAQWWHAAIEAERPGALTIWRASPQAKPADRRWDAHAFSRDVFRNLDAAHDRTGAYPSNVLLLNELSLNYERGDSENDVDPSMWRGRYSMLAQFLAALLTACKERAADRGWSPKWWFQGWAPGHGERDHVGLWGPVARLHDGIVLHSYFDRETITGDVLWYAEQFPSHPLLLGEWNVGRNDPSAIEEEARIKARLRKLCAAIPRLQCTYFIWKWEQDSGNRTYDIEGNDARLALWDGRRALPADDWQMPGLPAPPVEPPAPAPEPEPFPLPSWTPAPVDIIDGCVIVADEYLIPRDLLLGLCLAESGEGLQSFDRWGRYTAEAKGYIANRNKDGLRDILQRLAAAGSFDVSFGPAHQTYRWSKEFSEWGGDPYDVDNILRFRKLYQEDHGHALRVAATNLAGIYANYPATMKRLKG